MRTNTLMLSREGVVSRLNNGGRGGSGESEIVAGVEHRSFGKTGASGAEGTEAQVPMGAGRGSRWQKEEAVVRSSRAGG